MPENIYKRGAVWWFRAVVGGREVRRSLQTGDRKRARERAKELAERLNRQKWGDERRPWPVAVGKWLEEIAPGAVKPTTLRRYLSSIAVLAPVLDPLHLDEIDGRVLARIASRPKVSNATRRRDLTAVSAVLSAAVGWGWIERNPAREMDRSRLRERRDPIVLPEEADVAELCRHLSPMLAGLVRFLEQTGLRLEEAAGLEWRQVDARRRALILERTKGGRPRAVPLSDAALGTLAGTVRHLTCPFVFWHPPAGRAPQPDRYRNLSSYLRQRRRAAGVPFTIHHLRHLFAVNYLRDGGGVYDLRDILGHSSLTVTESYLQYLTPEEVREAKRVAG